MADISNHAAEENNLACHLKKPYTAPRLTDIDSAENTEGKTFTNGVEVTPYAAPS